MWLIRLGNKSTKNNNKMLICIFLKKSLDSKVVKHFSYQLKSVQRVLSASKEAETYNYPEYLKRIQKKAKQR